VAPLRLVFWLRGSSGKIGFFVIFSGISPEIWISAQKQDTRAILLKTALVHVSCIQNTQIREEAIAKVFGKVDTFWTYQGLLHNLLKSIKEVQRFLGLNILGPELLANNEG
jgi:hypothetical protein